MENWAFSHWIDTPHHGVGMDGSCTNVYVHVQKVCAEGVAKVYACSEVSHGP